MTMRPQHTTTAPAPAEARARRGFDDSERLRALLIRLHEEGQRAWRDDPEAAALMQHAARRYASLARAHGLDPWEAAAAAFDAMRTGSVRHAIDPWAVITRAVQVTCIAEERANGLLCSVQQARRPKYSAHHDAERFSDRENPLTDYHPAFRIPGPAAPSSADDADDESARVRAALDEAVRLFQLLGWPEEAVRSGVDTICTRLMDAASRASAFESLRRDAQVRVLLDLPAESWLTMLRLLLGSPDPAKRYTAASRGVLFRLLSGEPVEALFADADLMRELVLAAPPVRGDRHGG